MGLCASKSDDGGDTGGASGNPGRKLKRTKSITVDANRMRRTKSAVYDPELEDQENDAAAQKLTRRTSTVGTNAQGKTVALPVPEKTDVNQAKIEVGVFTHVGDPDVHPNEDRATAVLDLLGKFPPAGQDYKGDANQMVSFFGIYDGHGGSSCSEWLRKNLHIEVAKRLYTQNTDAELPAALIKCFDEVERDYCYKFAPGSCCVTTMIKGRKIFCADCGDSMAVVYGPDKKMHKLNDRHGVEFSKKEITRLRGVKAEISTDYETEGAVISRDSRGRFIKALYPTRGFGDADFKELVTAACKVKNRPKEEYEVVIATPTGAGIGYEGEAFEMKGSGPYWLMLGCDGLWDFMKEDQITKAMFSKSTPQAMAEHLVKVAQAPPFSSYDDVTIVVCKIEFD